MESIPRLTHKNKTDELSILLNAYKKEYTDFIDLAAHDLDAPLRKLSTLVEMLTNKYKTVLEDNDIERYIVRIETCISDMRSLIDSLSVLSRISSDKIEYSSCNIEAIIKETLADLEQAIKAKKAAITTSALPVIKGDRKQYALLFKHILENALKFSRPDIPPEIQIESSVLSQEEKKQFNLPAENTYYKIEIADNGIGFKQEYAEKIFQPFVRLHGKSQYPGNGISLAICKKIIDSHEGIIYVEGEENKGARFILVLPEKN
jgi:light-regulated signal transduction histidine kinase (bacteriophytochrome)